MSLSLLSRYAVFAACVLFTLASLPFLHHEWLWPFTLTTAVLSLIGLFDLLQQRHAVRRNYPILGNIRYLVEGIRPEIRQYLLEADSDALPFSRAQRSLVYARAKNEASDKPFGTLIDVYESGFEFIGHSMRPAPLADPASFRIIVGGPQCSQPYSASIFNISAMSFGSLSANAIRALTRALSWATSTTIPAKAASALTTGNTVATWSGSWAAATLAAARLTGASTPSASPPRLAARRCA